MMKMLVLFAILACVCALVPSASAADPPTSLPDLVECSFDAQGFKGPIPIAPEIRLFSASTVCKTTVFEFQGFETFLGQQCSFFVERPTLRWYHGNQLHDGSLRAGAEPYAVLRDDSLPLDVC
jgi:hypothetical protein